MAWKVDSVPKAIVASVVLGVLFSWPGKVLLFCFFMWIFLSVFGISVFGITFGTMGFFRGFNYGIPTALLGGLVLYGLAKWAESDAKAKH